MLNTFLSSSLPLPSCQIPIPTPFLTHGKSEILRAENQIAANKLLQASTISHKKLDTKCGHLPKWAWGNMWECIAPERPYGSHKETRQCQIIYTHLNSNFLDNFINILTHTANHSAIAQPVIYYIKKAIRNKCYEPDLPSNRVHAERKFSIKGQATSL